MLCVIASKKYGILFKWATRVRGEGEGRLSGWLVGVRMPREYIHVAKERGSWMR